LDRPHARPRTSGMPSTHSDRSPLCCQVSARGHAVETWRASQRLLDPPSHTNHVTDDSVDATARALALDTGGIPAPGARFNAILVVRETARKRKTPRKLSASRGFWRGGGEGI